MYVYQCTNMDLYADTRSYHPPDNASYFLRQCPKMSTNSEPFCSHEIMERMESVFPCTNTSQRGHQPDIITRSDIRRKDVIENTRTVPCRYIACKPNYETLYRMLFRHRNRRKPDAEQIPNLSYLTYSLRNGLNSILMNERIRAYECTVYNSLAVETNGGKIPCLIFSWH